MNSDNMESLLNNSEPLNNFSGESESTSMFKNINMTTFIIIILLLAFLGLNIFQYLAQGVDDISDILKPVVDKITSIFAYITSVIVGVTAAGTKNIVDSTANTIDKGLTSIENRADEITDKGNQKIQNATTHANTTTPANATTPTNTTTPANATTPTSLSSENANPPKEFVSNGDDPIDKVFAAAAANQGGQSGSGYEADDSTSKIQSGGGKSGWCYIGEDRGFRSCIEIDKGDQCMSEQIYPSKDICVNPRLRN